MDFDEFVMYVLPRDGDYSQETLNSWWRLLDIDGDGLMTKDEFFVYSLCASSRRAGAGLEAIFRSFDEDDSGKLDAIAGEIGQIDAKEQRLAASPGSCDASGFQIAGVGVLFFRLFCLRRQVLDNRQ